MNQSNNNAIKENLNNWLLLDIEIKKKNSELKKLKDKKEEIGKLLTDFLINNNLENNVFKIRDEYIKLKITNSKESMSQTYIKKSLVNFFNDKNMADKLSNYLLENREVKSAYLLSKIDKKNL